MATILKLARLVTYTTLNIPTRHCIPPFVPSNVCMTPLVHFMCVFALKVCAPLSYIQSFKNVFTPKTTVSWLIWSLESKLIVFLI